MLCLKPFAGAVFAVGTFVLLAGACAGTSRTNPPAHAAVSASASTTLESQEPPEPEISMVNAAVVISACPDAKSMNMREARNVIRRLVDPCAMVPGGQAHFLATLQPGGKTELASPSGDTASGVVPTCVLQHGLTHKVALKKPCKFDVTLEERPNALVHPNAVGRDGGSP